MADMIDSLMARLGLSEMYAAFATPLLACLIVALLSFVANFLGKKIVLRLVSYVVRKTANQWDDALAHRRVFLRLSHIAPALVIWHLAPSSLPPGSPLITLAQRGAIVYMSVVGAAVLLAMLNGLLDIYNKSEAAQKVSIESFIQATRIMIVLATAILVLSVVLSKSPAVLLGGAAAFTAVVMLVFREPLLNLVASIWIITNKSIYRGEHIRIPRFDIDGVVQEIGLHTVLVKQHDMTIRTLPTHALVSEGVTNMRGIMVAGGRRIQRSIWIDLNTIRFVDAPLWRRLEQLSVLRSYLTTWKQPDDESLRDRGAPEMIAFESQRLTNVGAFRAYAEAYLRQHPGIQHSHTTLVRQQQPTERGLPIEIYAVTNDAGWPESERIQADILDHLLAAVPYFSLRVYQGMSGNDFGSAITARVSSRETSDKE